MKKNKPIVVRNSIILSAAIILLLIIMTGCSTLHRKMNTVTVEGTGTITAVPDTVQLSVSISEMAQTTQKAQELVNVKIDEVLSILRALNVEERNIRTASITFNPEYSWNEGIQTLMGQRASQTILFQLDDIAETPQLASSLLDRLTAVDGIRMQQMHFDISDKTPLFSKSRELAFLKAKAKAEEYAAMSDMSIVEVISISESGTPAYTPPMTNRLLLESQSTGQASSSLPTGEMEITTRITVVFKLK